MVPEYNTFYRKHDTSHIHILHLLWRQVYRIMYLMVNAYKSKMNMGDIPE